MHILRICVRALTVRRVLNGRWILGDFECFPDFPYFRLN